MKTLLKSTVTVLTILIACPLHAEELGRLFFTHAQRTQLNYGNLQNGDSANDTSLMVNGIVQRNGGKRTAWINGVPRSIGQSDQYNTSSLPISVPDQSRPVNVKVGQKINITPGEASK